MFRPLVVLTTLSAAAAAPGQAGLMTRTDSVNNTAQATFRTQSSSRSSRTAVVLALPDQTQPDYTFGYGLTTPNTGVGRPVIFNDLFTRNFYTGFNIDRSIVVNASGHSFTIPTGAGAFSIAGPVRFTAAYRSSGIAQRYVYFSTAPSARITGPTADLTATLNSTRLGQFSQPQFHITGFFTSAAGINVVNFVSQTGNVSINTFRTVAPASFTIGNSRLTLPRHRVTVPGGPGNNPVTTEFRAFYELHLEQ